MTTTDSCVAMPLQTYALELHAVQHCNLRCLGCAQSSPDLSPGYEDIAVAERALVNLQGVLACEKLQVVGGEPLLHPRLPDLLQIAAASGLARKLTIKTNGLLLNRMPKAFWTLTDEVIVSVYPASWRALDRARSALEDRAADAGTVLTFRDSSEFRWITNGTEISNSELVKHVFARCEYKRFTHSLRDGRLYRCAPSVNVVRSSGRVAEDSIDVLDSRNLRGRVADFLSLSRPLWACRRCLGSSGDAFRHSLISRPNGPATAA